MSLCRTKKQTDNRRARLVMWPCNNDGMVMCSWDLCNACPSHCIQFIRWSAYWLMSQLVYVANAVRCSMTNSYWCSMATACTVYNYSYVVTWASMVYLWLHLAIDSQVYSV